MLSFQVTDHRSRPPTTRAALQWAAAEKSLLPRAAGFSLRRNRGAASLLVLAPPAVLPRLNSLFFRSFSTMSLETEIKTLAAAMAGHTAALADLAAAVRAVATGRSLNAAAAADQAPAPAPVVMPATTAAPAEEQTAPVMPAAPKAVAPAAEVAAESAPAGMPEPARVEAEAPRSESAAETAAPTDRAAAELAEMTPTAFMERIRELTQGAPSVRDVLASVLKAHGWSSFRTLDRSEYQTALDGIAAELAVERA